MEEFNFEGDSVVIKKWNPDDPAYGIRMSKSWQYMGKDYGEIAVGSWWNGGWVRI